MKQLVFWLLVLYAIERIVETFWKRKKISGAIIAPYTLPLLIGTYVLMYLVTFWQWAYWDSGQSSTWIAFGGTLMILASIAGRNWAIQTLGLYHSIHIEIRADHECIRSGPYGFVRNPYYLSNMVEAIGVPLAANAWFALLGSVFLYIPLLALRLVLEEKALKEKFGSSFIDYKKRVPRIIPKISIRGKR